MPTTLQSCVALMGRILLSAIFLLSGATKIINWSGTIEYMEQYGMPAVPLFLVLAILTEILGGLAILVGFLTRTVALLLVVFLIPTTLIFHSFWALSDPMEFQNQMHHFLKNLAIMGGLLGYSAAGAGAHSLDAHRDRPGLAPDLFLRQHRPV